MEIQSEIATRNLDDAEPTKREAQNKGETMRISNLQVHEK
jgi:hypothetical protein